MTGNTSCWGWKLTRSQQGREERAGRKESQLGRGQSPPSVPQLSSFCQTQLCCLCHPWCWDGPTTALLDAPPSSVLWNPHRGLREGGGCLGREPSCWARPHLLSDPLFTHLLLYPASQGRPRQLAPGWSGLTCSSPPNFTCCTLTPDVRVLGGGGLSGN